MPSYWYLVGAVAVAGTVCMFVVRAVTRRGALPPSPAVQRLNAATDQLERQLVFWSRCLGILLVVASSCVAGLAIAGWCLMVDGEHGNANYYMGLLLRRILRWPVFPLDFDIRVLQGSSDQDEAEGKVMHSTAQIDALLPSPCVYICNHQSALDILTMSRMWPRHVSVIAKSSLRFYPFIGWYMYLAGAIFIKRRNKTSAIDTINEAAACIQTQKSGVFLFPEGTRSDRQDGKMLAFKKGAFHMAIKARVPIIPVVFSRYDSVFNLARRHIVPGTIAIRILPPVSTDGVAVADMEDLMRKCYDDMQAVLDRIKSTPHNL